MHWLLMRPALSWGALLLVHAIGIPLVYGVGKACGAKKVTHEMVEETEHL
jgi:hypothetical protein